MIKASYTADSIISSSEDAFTLYERSRFGEKKGSEVEYSPVEALFLVKDGKMSLFQKSKPISFTEAISKIKKVDKKISTKFAVFSDLRKKGYIVKTALKFGAEFRVYERGVKPGEDHARWILYTAKEHESMNWHDFAAKNRIAHATKKRLLIGVVDEEGDVSYYECNWNKI